MDWLGVVEETFKAEENGMVKFSATSNYLQVAEYA